MIRKVTIVILSAACLACFLLGMAIRLRWTGFSWDLHDDTFRAVEPAQHIFLSGFHPGTLTISYGYLVKQSPGPLRSNRSERIDCGIFELGLCHIIRGYPGGWRNELWQYTSIGVPFWLISLLLGLYPMVAFVRGPYRRYRRRRKGLCLKCAYDLTGNVSGVCPECGEKI